MTSVKDVRVETEPTTSRPGTGVFAFSDDYSVFDWGRMPDAISGKGASLCAMGAYTFERLEDEGVSTHYRGVRESGNDRPLQALDEPPTEMAIELVNVPELPYTGDGYDYAAYHEAGGEAVLLPLEIVFRNVVAPGSSLRSRADPSEYGLEGDEWPSEAVPLPEPVVEFSTKFEAQDRYLDEEEAAAIAGPASLSALEDCARAVNDVITDLGEAAGFTHQDGKIECLYHGGDIKVADVAGTFDENRFSREGTQLSKEVIRQYYRQSDPEWVQAVSEAKQAAREGSDPNWRDRVDMAPKPLPEHVLRHVSNMYRAGANAYLGRDRFDAPPLEGVLEHVRRI